MMSKSITAKSNLAKRTLNAWLSENDKYSQDLLKEFSIDFGPFEFVRYRNRDNEKQSDLIDKLSDATKRNMKFAMIMIKENLK